MVDAALGLALAAVNDAPTGQPTVVLAAGREDTRYTIAAADLLKGFADVDGDTLSVTGLTADHGTIVTNDDGSHALIPAADYNGSVTLSYTVTDGVGGRIDAIRSLTLAAVNDGPTELLIVGGSVAEVIASGTLAATVTGIDADTDDILSYRLLDDAGGRFAIEASTGRITVASNRLLDYEMARSHDLLVEVSDAGGYQLSEDRDDSTQECRRDANPLAYRGRRRFRCAVR